MLRTTHGGSRGKSHTGFTMKGKEFISVCHLPGTVMALGEGSLEEEDVLGSTKQCHSLLCHKYSCMSVAALHVVAI